MSDYSLKKIQIYFYYLQVDMATGHSPLDQFRIKTLVQMPEVAGYNVDFTNSAFAMVMSVILAYGFLMFGMRNRALVPTRFQALVEMTYEAISNTLRDNVGEAGRAYFPFVFSLFMFILMCNLVGMIPYQFTATSHIVVTFTLALIVFFAVTLIALYKHGLKFFGYFLPAGTPLWLAPIIYCIEVISYLSRPISLSVRLMANMFAGHIVVKIIAGFILMLGVGGIVPLFFVVFLTGFEIVIAILQAYVFTVLTCVYLHDAVHLH
jgi:F-type H+-transporting ATPase subunit a